MLNLQLVKSTFALAFSTIFLSSGLVSCGSSGGSGLTPSTSQSPTRSLRAVSVATPYGSNTCVGSAGSGYTCYLAFGGSASVTLPEEQISLGSNNCQGSWTPGWFSWSTAGSSVPATISALFSKQSGSGACKSNVSATITYHESSPATTPESQSYLVMGTPNYSYTWCQVYLHNECAGPNGSLGGPQISVWVDAPPTPAPCPVGTPGPNLLKEIPVTDKNGNKIIGASGFQIFRPDDGHDANFFINNGLYEMNTINNLDINSSINSVYNFRQAGSWDEQRVGGDGINITDPNFVDWATVDIGIFGAASGIPEEVVQRAQELYAALYSNFGIGVKYQAGYPGLPARNAANLDIGYRLYNGGQLKVTLCQS